MLSYRLLPSELVGQRSEAAVVTLGCKAEVAECGGHDHALGALEVLGDTLVDLQVVLRGTKALGVVAVVLGDHSTDL